LANLEDLRVLVVDDNSTNRCIMEEMLQNWRMRPVLAESGQSALEVMTEAHKSGRPFKLIILDMNMPVMDGFELAEKIRKQEEYSNIPIMILTSSGLRGDAARCQKLEIAAYLTKPVKQSSLLDAILTVLGRIEPEGAEAPLVTQYMIREEGPSLRILLAEDNEVNQKIATSMLGKRGHIVIVVGNGKNAVSAYEDQGGPPFDLILMDVQMPVMDGLEATRLIRQREKNSGKHIPIVALTAHAMKGDKEMCLDAGMDGYLSKPLRKDELISVIRDLMFSQRSARSNSRSFQKESGDVFDYKKTMAAVDGDIEFLKEVVGLFIENIPKSIAEIRNAVMEGDMYRLERTAHSLKGAVANFGATRAFNAAYQLERIGREKKTDKAELVLTELERELNALESALNRVVSGEGKQPLD